MSRWQLFKSFCKDSDNSQNNDEIQLCIQGKSIQLLPNNILIDLLEKNKHRNSS